MSEASHTVEVSEARVMIFHSHDEMTSAIFSASTWFGMNWRVSLAGVIPDVDERRQIERRLNLWLSLCGCQLATFIFLGVIGWRCWKEISVGSFGAQSLIITLGAALVGAICAKIAVTAVSRTIFAFELWNLMRKLRHRADLISGRRA